MKLYIGWVDDYDGGHLLCVCDDEKKAQDAVDENNNKPNYLKARVFPVELNKIYPGVKV